MADCLQQLSAWDSSLLLYLNNMHNGFFDILMLCITGKWIWIPLYCSILYLMLKNFGVRTVVTYTIAIAITILMADQIGDSVIRPMVERLRPSNPSNPISSNVHLVNGYHGSRYGFPSCHAANTFGLTFFLIYMFRNRVMTLFFVIWASLVCYSRIYLGVHYPGDILAGMVLGLIVASLAYALARRVTPLQRPEKYKQVHVPWIVGCLTLVCMTIYAIIMPIASA